MKPFKHARITARKFGGMPEDYYDIHDFIDHTKQNIPDVRHRLLLHNSWGCFLVEKIFGKTRKNSEGREYSPRDVAEQHIIDDLGFIPTLERCFRNVELETWMGGPKVKGQSSQLLAD